MARAILSRVLIAGAALGLAGCADALLSDSVTTCADDQACPGDLVCAFGACLDPLDQRLDIVDIEVDPGSASGAPVQNVLQVDLSTTPRVDMQLRPGVTLSGQVSSGGTGVQANVLLRPALSIPGRALAPRATSNADGAFGVLVVDEARYALTVTPLDPTRTPFYDDEPVRIEGDGGEFILDPIALSDVGPIVVGRVIAGSGAAALGIDGLQVHVERDDGRRLSSSATTDPSGGFRVALAEPVENVVLVVAPSAENASYPTVTVPGLTLVDGENPLGDVELGDVLTPVPVPVTVLDATGGSVIGARLTVQGVVGNGILALAVEATEAGDLDLRLPPGIYDLAVVGHPSDPTAGLLIAEQVEIGPEAEPLVLSLPGRVTASGTVRDAAGAPVPSATLSFVRIGSVDGQAEPVLGGALVAFEARAEPDGTWSATLDPGRYRLSTRPPPSSTAPAFSEIITVDDGRTTHDVDLPQRAIVAGTVLLGGAPQAGAYVRVYSALLDERGAAILVGEGTADDAGAFEVAVPDLVPDVTEPEPP